MKKVSTLQKELNKVTTLDYDMSAGEFLQRPVKSFIDSNNILCVTSDNGQSCLDYYGEFRGNYPYIDDKIEKFAKDNGMIWEWKDPSTIGLYE